MTLLEFYDRLAKHDWYFTYSDDNRVYLAGDCESRALQEISRETPEHTELYRAFSLHMFSGEPWGTEKQPRPKREDYVDR